VIAEVTPRFRAMMEKKGIDWSTEGLRKAIKGQWVEIRGWIFFDPEHVEESFANDPKDEVPGKNWRASCWEIHPITYIKIGGSGILPKQITPEDVPGNRDTATPTTFFFFWVVLAAIALLLLWLIVRRRR
jgi:hypothetical protein